MRARDRGDREEAKQLYRRLIMDLQVPGIGRDHAVQKAQYEGLMVICGSYGVDLPSLRPDLLRYHQDLYEDIGTGYIIYSLRDNSGTGYGILNRNDTLNKIGLI